ncbi:hypothetical protein ACKF11_12990 [Methylobacillus sp. Pita2]|uniref:hypothetical protein n=1 Tax=Methylobacillus sp. Pita2 TaxID=3383245 RepID=UPI0038B69E20
MRVSDFGFQSTGFPDGMELEISAGLYQIANSFGLNPAILGSGILLSMGDAPSVELDQISNRVKIVVDPNVSRSGLAYQWALALHKFNFIESYEDTINHLVYTFISPEEFNKRMVTRWKNAEMGIQHAMESIFDNASDPELAALAMRQFNGYLDGVVVNSTDGAAEMLKRLRKDGEALECEVDNDTCALLALLLGMRAECIRDIQGSAKSVDRLHDGSMRTKLSYFARMDLLAELDQYSHVTEIAPAIAIASYVSKEMKVEFNIYDRKLLPVANELEEISGRIPAFAAEIAKRQESLFDADIKASLPAPGIKLR